MTTTHRIAAAILLVAGTAARAAGPEYVDPAQGFQSSRTRAEVMEELRQARAQETRVGSEAYPGENELMARARSKPEEQPALARANRPAALVAGN